MNPYDFVFVILVYRNAADLEDCIISIEDKVMNKAIIVVNAYYDKQSEKSIHDVAVKHNCIYLNIENKGYSYGNNVGISYARKNLTFKYVIVSNPDIEVEKFKSSDELSGDIIAPEIIAASGNRQNPMQAKESKLAEKLIYRGYKNKNKPLFLFGVGIHKINRILFRAVKSHDKGGKIYCAHGSFVIFSNKACERLGNKFYDENLFLFAEEAVLAFKAKEIGLNTFFDSGIIIRHKEDGSMKLSDLSVDNEMAKANMYYYEHYRLNKGE